MLNCKVDLKLKWTNYCAFSAAGADNINANTNGNINVFTIKDTKILSKILSPRDNQKLSAKDSKDQFIEMNMKQKEIKMRQMNLDIFSNQTLL